MRDHCEVRLCMISQPSKLGPGSLQHLRLLANAAHCDLVCIGTKLHVRNSSFFWFKPLWKGCYCLRLVNHFGDSMLLHVSIPRRIFPCLG